MKTRFTKHVVALLVCLGVAGVAYAAPALQRLHQIFSGGVTISNTSAGMSSSNNKVKKFMYWSQVYDAPSLENGYNHTFNATATGATAGDVCVVGVSGTLNEAAVVRCQVEATNTVKVMLSNSGGDGGALDLPDAGYSGWFISNQ